MEKYNRWGKCGKLIYNTAGYYLEDYAFGIKHGKLIEEVESFCQLLGHWFPEFNMHLFLVGLVSNFYNSTGGENMENCI